MIKFCLAFIFIFIGTACSSFSKEDEEAAKIHLQIGTSQLQEGNYPQALSELLKAESLDPKNPLIQNNLGLAYYYRGRADLAETRIRKALTLNPGYTDARSNLARVLTERGRYIEAAREAELATEDLTYPHPEKPLINLGIALFKLGQYEKARKTFQKALDFQRDNCLAQSYYGRCLFELKQYRQSAEALDRAAGFCQESQFDEPQYYSALSYYELGEKSKAEYRLEGIIKLYPQGKYTDKAKSMLDTIRR